MNVLNAIELFNLIWLILCYIKLFRPENSKVLDEENLVNLITETIILLN